MPCSPDRVLRFNYSDTDVVQRVFGSACYITDSWPSVLYLAYKHSDSFEEAVLANTNAGGENCHRGAALGALMGAAHGRSGIPDRFVQELHASKDIGSEIDSYIHALFPDEAAQEERAKATAAGTASEL